MAATIGEDFARAIAAKDADALRGLLSADVDFRAMTPLKFWESNSADEVIDKVIFDGWLPSTEHIDALDAVESVESDSARARHRVGYRLRVTNADGTFLVDQQAYYHVDNGRIDWLRIMCAGYQPV